MKVLFDHQIFCYKYGGASKYFAMLLNYMPVGTWSTTSLFSVNEYVREKKLFCTFPNYIQGQSILADYANRCYTNYILSKGNYDIFHQTNFGTYCLKALGRKPMVTTYHDSNLSTIDPHEEIVKRQRISLERAEAIICVSQNTKKDMLELFNIDEKKAFVIYHGIEQFDLSMLPQRPIYEFPYILYVGRRSVYKNFNRLVQAFSIIHYSHNDIHLVCTSQPFTKEELSMFQQLGITDFVHNINADEKEMKRLYRDALLFVFPSLYEGFGMPILEAWSCECPIALSDTSCFPEIAQDAASFFNPKDVEEMTDCILKIIEDNGYRTSLIEKGNSRVKDFSWSKTAEEHIKVYNLLI